MVRVKDNDGIRTTTTSRFLTSSGGILAESRIHGTADGENANMKMMKARHPARYVDYPDPVACLITDVAGFGHDEGCGTSAQLDVPFV